MNLVVLKGRLTKDPEIKYTQAAEPVAIANFSVAVNRSFKREGQPDADFFNCSAFGKTAQFVEKYFTKGKEILLRGNIQNRSWEDSGGNKRYATDIIADNVEFCGSKGDGGGDTQRASTNTNPSVSSSEPGGFVVDMEMNEDDDLPF